MSGIFGQAYRREVQDANDGAIQPERTGLKSNLTTSGRKITYTGQQFDDSKYRLAEALLQFGGAVVQRKIETSKQKEFNEGYAKGTEEGLEEAQEAEPEFLSWLGGKTSALRGFQQRVVDDSINQDYTRRVGSMETDAVNFNTEQYRVELQNDIQNIAERYSDPEVRSNVIKGLTKNAQRLAGTHVQLRVKHEKELRERATIDSIMHASESLHTAAATGRGRDILENADRLMQSLKKPEGMTDRDYSSVVTTAVIGQLRNNDNAVMDFLETSGKLETLESDDRAALEHELVMYEARNDRRYHTDKIALFKAIEEQHPNVEQLAIDFGRRYPNFDINKAREHDEKVKTERRKQAIQDAQDDWLIQTQPGSAEANSLSHERKRKAVARMVDDYATAGLRKQRREQISEAQHTGVQLSFDPIAEMDGSVVYSEQEKAEYIRANPEGIISTWRAHQMPMDFLRTQVAGTMAILSSDEITQADFDQAVKDLDYLKKFEDSDPALFQEHFANEQTAARYSALTGLIDAGAAPRNALETMRRIDKAQDINLADEYHSNRVATNYKDAADNILDAISDKHFWIFNNTPENNALFESTVAETYREAYRMAKGNADVAAYITQGKIIRNSRILGDNFVLNGKQWDAHNPHKYDLAYYINGMNAYPGFDDILQQNGFPPDIDLLDDDRVTIRPSRGGRMIQFSMYSEEYPGQIVTLERPLPQRPSDMKGSGFWNWVGNKFGMYDKDEIGNRN